MGIPAAAPGKPAAGLFGRRMVTWRPSLCPSALVVTRRQMLILKL